MAPQLIVLLGQALDADADTHVLKPRPNLQYPLMMPSRSGYHNPFGFGGQDPDDLIQILAQKRLAPRQVDKGKTSWQNRQFLCRDFVILICEVLPDIAPLTAHLAAAGQNDAGVGW